MIFKVVGIEKTDSDKPVAKLTLQGKHTETFYISQLFIKVPWSNVQQWPIDAEFELVPYLPQGNSLDQAVLRCMEAVEKAEAKAAQ